MSVTCLMNKMRLTTSASLESEACEIKCDEALAMKWVSADADAAHECVACGAEAVDVLVSVATVESGAVV